MDAIVAVYSDWGIGAKGTQPVVLKADRKLFKELTDGSTVIVGRKTLEDFPGGKPLKNRRNIVVSRQDIQIDGADVVHSLEEAVEVVGDERSFVIGGASVFDQFFTQLDRVYVTKIDLCPESDSYFPNLDEDEDWIMVDAGEPLCENGINYRFTCYERRKDM